MRTSIERAAIAALLALAAGAASGADSAAHALRDPTRPPAAAGLAPSGAAEAAPAAPQLQAVRLGAGAAQRVAVIDGESVRVGERFRGARVVRIGDSEVVLESGRERQVLRLYASGETAGMTRVAQGRE